MIGARFSYWIALECAVCVAALMSCGPAHADDSPWRKVTTGANGVEFHMRSSSITVDVNKNGDTYAYGLVKIVGTDANIQFREVAILQVDCQAGLGTLAGRALGSRSNPQLDPWVRNGGNVNSIVGGVLCAAMEMNKPLRPGT